MIWTRAQLCSMLQLFRGLKCLLGPCSFASRSYSASGEWDDSQLHSQMGKRGQEVGLESLGPGHSQAGSSSSENVAKQLEKRLQGATGSRTQPYTPLTFFSLPSSAPLPGVHNSTPVKAGPLPPTSQLWLFTKAEP